MFIDPGTEFSNISGRQVIANARFAFYGAGLNPFGPNSGGKKIIENWQNEFEMPNRSNSTADTISKGVIAKADQNLAAQLHGRQFIITKIGEVMTLPRCFYFSPEVAQVANMMPNNDFFITSPFGQLGFATQWKHLLKRILGYSRIRSTNETDPIAVFEVDSTLSEPSPALAEYLFAGGNESKDIYINWSECSNFSVDL